MEEFDELLPTPDSEGSLELSHRAWTEVDEIVWTMGEELRVRQSTPKDAASYDLFERDFAATSFVIVSTRQSTRQSDRRQSEKERRRPNVCARTGSRSRSLTTACARSRASPASRLFFFGPSPAAAESAVVVGMEKERDNADKKISRSKRPQGCCSFSLLRMRRPELGDLKQLLELDCSCNQLEVLPERIGNLKHLRRLKVSGNKLTTLPDDIGKCLALEELIISENDIVSRPRGDHDSSFTPSPSREPLSRRFFRVSYFRICLSRRLSFFSRGFVSSPTEKKRDWCKKCSQSRRLPRSLGKLRRLKALHAPSRRPGFLS